MKYKLELSKRRSISISVKGGELVDKQVGACQKAALQEKIEKLL